MNNMQTTDERVGQFLVFIFIVLVLAATIIFFSPLTIFTLIFALITRQFINNRISTIIALLSLIGLGASLKIWTALPLIQFASWWKGVKPLGPILKFVEDKIQGGLPFSVTYKSYIMCLLVSFTLAKVLVFLFNRAAQ
mgnify:FL=1